MNRETMMKAMTASISEVMETMFFMPVDVVASTVAPDIAACPALEHVNAKLSFSGPIKGSMLLQVPASLALAITADFLGVSPSLVETNQVAGTVMEMVNMLTGNTLSVYDAEAIFDLGVPGIVNDQRELEETTHDGEPICLNLDTSDSRIVLTLTCRA